MLHLDRLKSLLFLPASRDDRLQKAAQTKAGAIILDLEDSVAATAKGEARAKLASSIETLRKMGRGSIVRINAGSEMVPDIAALSFVAPDAVMIPKVERAADLEAVIGALATAGLPETIQIVALVETPAGIQNLYEIAKALPRDAALAFGGEDFATAMSVAPGMEELSFAAHHVALAARAQGLAAFGVIGSIAEVKDQDAFLSYCRAARKAGFTGALAIHPSQVETAAIAFSPSAAELDWALAIVEDAKGSDGAAIKGRDGRMIDRPILDRARNILNRA